MVYNSQRGRGFNDIFGTLNRTFKPVIEGAADVGANLATGLDPRKNVNNREDVFFLPRFIIPAGIILATI